MLSLKGRTADFRKKRENIDLHLVDERSTPNINALPGWIEQCLARC